MSKPLIAFLGLGIMGGGMARRLLTHEFPLAVFNRNPDRAKLLANESARVATSPRNAAQNADFVISMVADDVASRAMWLGENGALAGARAGSILIECSTLTVDWIRELAAAAEKQKCPFLDAPVTGSKMHAANGELNFLVGGEPATVEQARPVLAAMSKTILPLGPVGSGALLKLINNFVCGVQAASFVEALALIDRTGLDRVKALEILTNGAPGSPIVKTINARIAANDYSPNFPLRLMTKDLGYAVKEGKKNSVDLLTAAAALQEFQRALTAGHGDLDMAAVYKPFRETRHSRAS